MLNSMTEKKKKSNKVKQNNAKYIIIKNKKNILHSTYTYNIYIHIIFTYMYYV